MAPKPWVVLEANYARLDSSKPPAQVLVPCALTSTSPNSLSLPGASLLTASGTTTHRLQVISDQIVCSVMSSAASLNHQERDTLVVWRHPSIPFLQLSIGCRISATAPTTGTMTTGPTSPPSTRNACPSQHLQTGWWCASPLSMRSGRILMVDKTPVAMRTTSCTVSTVSNIMGQHSCNRTWTQSLRHVTVDTPVCQSCLRQTGG